MRASTRRGLRHGEGRALIAGKRVLIADDHPPIRMALRAALELEGFVVCAEAGSASAAVDAAVRERPDVCLLDVKMPGGGVPAARDIAAKVPGAAVVMLTGSGDDDDFFAALRAGVSGYLLKNLDPDDLGGELRRVLNGEAALPGTLVARLVDEFRTRDAKRRLPVAGRVGVQLTGREAEVLELLRKGRTTAEIAEGLAISPVTVRRYVSDIVKKLGVSDREAAVRLLETRSDA